MIAPQILQIKRELLELANNPHQKKQLHEWFTKYVISMTVQEAINEDRLSLMTQSTGYLEHVKRKMFAKIGEGIRESGFAIETRETGKERYEEVDSQMAHQMEGTTFYTAKVFILGAK